jgi:hypothetical protein
MHLWFSGVGARSVLPTVPPHFVRLQAQQLHRRAVGADEAGFEVFVDVGDRRLFVEVAEAALLLA